MIIFDASAPAGAAVKLNSIPENTPLRAEETDILALSCAVHSEMAAVLERPGFGSRISAERRAQLEAAVWSDPVVPVSDCRDANGLIALDPWRGVRILRPATFLAVPCP